MKTELKNWAKQTLLPLIPDRIQTTAMIHALGLFRIPILFFVRPVVLKIDSEKIVLRIRLNRKSKNHLGSMYFGALAAGADCVVGFLAVSLMLKNNIPLMHLSFKDFHAEFLRRATGDVHFICEHGKEILEQIKIAQETKERINIKVPAFAIVPSESNEPVAKFSLTLSLKSK